jgi:hypothetical protein
LRFPFAAAVVAVLALAASGAFAKPSGLKVLVFAPVADDAQPTMSQTLWNKYVAAYAASTVVPFDGAGDPTLEDCRKAGADYLLIAPFELRPRLPGMPNSSGRIAARTHLIVTNCITGSAVTDQTINFDSDPPSDAAEGDFDSIPEITWAHDVPATLARHPIAFVRVARVTNLSTPFVFIDLHASSHVALGEGLRDFATPDHVRRARPILLTVTAVHDAYVEATYDAFSNDTPLLGDLVEAIPKGAPPAPTLSSAP